MFRLSFFLLGLLLLVRVATSFIRAASAGEPCWRSSPARILVGGEKHHRKKLVWGGVTDIFRRRRRQSSTASSTRTARSRTAPPGTCAGGSANDLRRYQHGWTTAAALLVQQPTRQIEKRRLRSRCQRTSSSCPVFSKRRRPRRSIVVLKMHYEGFYEGGYENDDDDDDDEPTIRPYGSRSLAWTRRYRALITYETARKMATKLGLQSQQEWEEYLEGGISGGNRNKYLISRPNVMYEPEWTTWEDFLGTIRPYHETKHLVNHVLQLQTLEEYTNFVTSNPNRAEGLRIPLKPEIVYKQKGWVSEAAFFSKDDDQQDEGDYRCCM